MVAHMTDQEKRKAARANWPVAKYGSHKEADEADEEYYAALTPQQRLDIMVELVARLQHGSDARLAGFHRLTTIKRR